MNSKCLVVILCAAYLTACAAILPDSAEVKLRDANRAQLAQSIRLASEQWPEACWWVRYHDAQLQHLIMQALHDSPSLASTGARLRLAQAKWLEVESQAGVDAGVSTGVTRQRFPAHDLYPPPLAGTWQSQSWLRLFGSWDFDWWGRNRAGIAAALGEQTARRADLAAAERALAAVVAQSYFIWQADEARLVLLRQQMSIQHALFDLAKRRVKLGFDPVEQQQWAQSDKASMGNEWLAQQTRIARDREVLRALIGGDASSLATLTVKPLPDDIIPALPSTLGLELLGRRPDLQAARWRVEAAIQTTRSDEAAFYPDVNLAAFFGYSLIGTHALLAAPNRNTGGSASFSFPIFASGRLNAQLGVSRAQRDIAIAQYNQALINAVQEVADQGITLQGLSRQRSAQRVALQAAEAVYNANQVRLTRGLINRATLLRSELPVLKQQEQLLQLRKDMLLADVALIKALGGGYDNNIGVDREKCQKTLKHCCGVCDDRNLDDS